MALQFVYPLHGAPVTLYANVWGEHVIKKDLSGEGEPETLINPETEGEYTNPNFNPNLGKKYVTYPVAIRVGGPEGEIIQTPAIDRFKIKGLDPTLDVSLADVYADLRVRLVEVGATDIVDA